jgi:hypothetical protein
VDGIVVIELLGIGYNDYTPYIYPSNPGVALTVEIQLTLMFSGIAVAQSNML